MHPTISVIIPTYNEGSRIAGLISQIQEMGHDLKFEIIVADGGSTDGTVEAVERGGSTLVKCKLKGRGAQLNAGAKAATGTVLFFLHADSHPPKNFLQDVLQAVKSGYDAGCFRLKFDSNNWFLKANAWFTRFDIDAVRFGDQGLFVTRQMFDQAGGYRNDHLLMEDQEMVIRLKKKGANFTVLKKSMTTSARKYEENGALALQYHFFIIWWNYYRGKSQAELMELYKKRIGDTRAGDPQSADHQEPVNPAPHVRLQQEGNSPIGQQS